jgi:hypothetical protein
MNPKTPMPAEDVSEKDRWAIERIAENIKNGDCVLFLGAGVNACSAANEPYYPKNLRPPMASELAETLRQELRDKFDFEFKDENNITLSRIAQYYELKSGDRLQLTRTLKTLIHDGKTPSPVLQDLANMPFEFIITTNYDQLFEQALDLNGKKPNIGVYNSDRRKVTTNFKKSEITKASPFVYKIHGDIITDKQSIVITDEDYIHFILRMSDKDDLNPIPHTFTDALSQKSILFIGYRLMDYNLRLLFKTLRWGKDPNSMPLNYSIDPMPDILIEKLFVNTYKTNFLVLDSWKIIPLLLQAIYK